MSNEYTGQKPTFTALPNWLRGQASPLELAILWCLQSHFPNIHPSMALLAEEACMSRRSVSGVLADMERKGWLVREHAFAEGGRRESNRYRLTIWDASWAIADRAGVALGQEMPYRSRAGDALSLGQEVHGVRAGGAHKEDQEKKNKKKKTYKPPLPPAAQGERRREAVRQHAVAVQPQPQQPPRPEPHREPPPEPAPHPEAIAPVKPQARVREAGFTPTQDDVPAALLPVARELLEFWGSKGGKRTQRAWAAQLRQLERIQDDPAGGTEIARAQLASGIDAAVFGRPWQAVTHANWQRLGTKAGPLAMQVGFRGRPTTRDRVLGAIALVEERERVAASRQAQGGLVRPEVA